MFIPVSRIGVIGAYASKTGGGGEPITPLGVGVNMTALEYAWSVEPSDADWAYIKSKGFKVIRIPFAWERMQPVLGGALNAAFLAKYTSAVNKARAFADVVVIDCHNYGTWDSQFDPIAGSPPGTYNHGSPGKSGAYKFGTAELTVEHFVDLWQRLTTAFNGVTKIAYGLMNEPHDLYGANLLKSSNHFSNNKGDQAWFWADGVNLTPRVAQSLSGFNDAWTMSDGLSGGGYGHVSQSITLPAGTYTFSCEVSVQSGTKSANLSMDFANYLTFNATTTRTRQSKTFTLEAGDHTVNISMNTADDSLMRIANACLRSGTTDNSYIPDVWPTYAQAAITAIRAIDTVTPIWVAGDEYGRTTDWLRANVNIGDLVDPSNKLVFEGHSYFDTDGSGVYTQTYDQIMSNGDGLGSGAIRGENVIKPFKDWATTYGKDYVVGEVGYPNDDVRWNKVFQGFRAYLGSDKTRSIYWEYHTRNVGAPSFFIGAQTKLGLGREDHVTDAPQLAYLSSDDSDGRVPYDDQQAFSANGYTAFASPWSTYPGGANSSLSRPADYQDIIRVKPSTFPDDSLIQWRWPVPGTGVVAGYMHIARGNYDGSDAFGWVPWQVGNITTFTETFDLETTGTAADFVVLNEFYLTTTSGNPETDAYEIGHWLHAAGAALTFFNASALIGDYTDADGRIWEVRNTGPNPTGAAYIVFLLKSRADILSGTIDKRAALLWLVGTGLALNHLWVNGTAVGVEPYRGTGSMLVKDYAVSFAGSGSVIPSPPTNLIVNGDFSGGDANWQGFYYSGKEPSGGRAVFTNAPAYDGIFQNVGALTSGRYYEVTFTMTRTAGSIFARLGGGTTRNGTERNTAGTYTQRLLANTGNNLLQLDPLDSGFTGTIDDVILTGPYTTATVGGA